jgi:alpha-N-arabinofuranosidase
MPPHPTICFDEWNVWDPIRAPGPEGAEELYDLSDAIAVSAWLNVFIRQSKYLGMATVAQSINVISPLMTTETGVIKQSTWWPLWLFSKYMRGEALGVHVRSGVYSGRTNPEWIKETGIDCPWLDVSSALSPDGYLTLAVVNIDEERDWKTEIKGLAAGTDVKVFTVGADCKDVRAGNMRGNPEEVGVVEGMWDGKGLYNFSKHSLTLLRWKAT